MVLKYPRQIEISFDSYVVLFALALASKNCRYGKAKGKSEEVFSDFTFGLQCRFTQATKNSEGMGLVLNKGF
jgi:hypothetical protein